MVQQDVEGAGVTVAANELDPRAVLGQLTTDTRLSPEEVATIRQSAATVIEGQQATLTQLAESRVTWIEEAARWKRECRRVEGELAECRRVVEMLVGMGDKKGRVGDEGDS
jgi:hypothetical protein